VKVWSLRPLLRKLVKVKVTLRLTVSQSVSISWCRAQIWDFWPEIFFFKVTVLSFLGHPRWREVGSVMCQSLSLKSTVVSHYLQNSYWGTSHLYKFLQVHNSHVSLVSSYRKTTVQWRLHRHSRTLIATGQERKCTQILYICSDMSKLFIILQNIPYFQVGSFFRTSQGFSGPRTGIIFTYLKSYNFSHRTWQFMLH
jgi:hypothetical protein